MSKKKPEKKVVNRTAEQIIAEETMKKELNRRKTKIKDVLYPMFNDMPFFDAANFLQGSEQMVQSIFMNRTRTTKFSDLEMKITEEAPFPELAEKVLGALQEESVESGLYMLRQIAQAIAAFRDNETKTRKISSYPTDFTV